MTRHQPAAADDADGRSLDLVRRSLVSGLIIFAVVQPAFGLLGHALDARGWFQVLGAVVLAGLACWRLNSREPGSHPVPWFSLAAILVLGIALFAVGGGNWLATLAVTAAVFGRYSQSPVPAVLGAAACGIAGLTVSIINGYQSGLILAGALIAPMAGLFAYSASRRADTLAMLRRTRAELARAAVAEERLRIARDLHDLLGHSLSLITLKAELAGRVISSDPARAAREIAELESVARRSLSDVREAVAGFRQPDLAGELVAARQLLDAAGITSQISSAGATDLPPDVDAALAWAVREGATNVVRHSKATQVTIVVSAGQGVATADISDNGPLAPDDGSVTPGVPALTAGPDGRFAASRARPAFAGSGLAGLAERVRSLGGEVAAGMVDPQGFRLRVVVPLSPEGVPISAGEAARAGWTMGA
jgi:two-component system, NarL family, sensor histidine kinase DesK